jgi:NAD(P)H dehydrogenase (quinone)
MIRSSIILTKNMDNGSIDGYQETTDISMMFPMFHHGMIVVGVPYSTPELVFSGSPYGPSRIVGPLSNRD